MDAAGNNGLWVTNGTAAGTCELTNISGADPGGLNPSGLTVFNNEVLFSGYDAPPNNSFFDGDPMGFWVTNGTAAGTYELTNISGANSVGLHPIFLTVFNNEVLFNGFDAAGQRGLWVTNGTAAGTYELTNISGAWSGGIFPSGLTVFNNEVLFSGYDAPPTWPFLTATPWAFG